MRSIFKELRQLKTLDCFFLTVSVLGVLLTLFATYDFSYTIFGDRLLLRASNILSQAQTMGPELTYEGRIPGGAFYYLTGLLFLPFSDPIILNTVFISLHIFAGLYLAVHVSKYTNKFTAYVVTAFFFSQHLLVPEILYLWNPSLAPILAVFILKGMTNIFIDNRGTSTVWLLPLIGIAAQVHLSFFTLVFTFIVLLFIYKKSFKLSYILMGSGLLVLTYSPYIASELSSGFLNTELLSKSAFNVNDYKNLPHYLVDTLKHLPLFIGGIQSGWENRVPSGNFLNSIKYYFAFPTTLFIFFCAVYYSMAKQFKQNALVKLCSLTLLISLAILFFTMTPIRSRRVLFLLPYVLVIMSSSIYSFTALGPNFFLRNNARLKRALVVSLSSFFFLFHLACFAYEIHINTRQPFNNEPSLFFSYRDFLEVIELSKENGVTRSELRYGMTFIDKDEKWLWTSFKNNSVYNVTRFAIDYLADWKYGKTADRAIPLKTCYFFTRNHYLTDHHLRKESLNLKDFGFIDRPARYLGSTFNFSLFSYQSWNGNCVRRVNNRYNPTSQEKLLSQLKHGLIQNSPPSTAYSVLDIPHSTELSFLITVEPDKSGKSIIGLHSPELRGYDGPSRYWLESPKIVLTHIETKKVHQIEFFPSGVESIVRMDTYWDQYHNHNLILTPFWSSGYELESGSYSVEVIAKSLKFGYFAYFDTGLIQPFRHRFESLLEVD